MSKTLKTFFKVVGWFFLTIAGGAAGARIHRYCFIYDCHKENQYACAVCLILSSICLVTYQVIEIDDVANGLLFYVGQAFLLAGSMVRFHWTITLTNQKPQEARNNTAGFSMFAENIFFVWYIRYLRNSF